MNTVEKSVDNVLADSEVLKLKLELENIHITLTKHYNLMAKIANKSNLFLKVVASAVVLLFLMKTYIVGEKYTKLEKYQLLTYYFNYNLSSLRNDSEETQKIADLLDYGQYNEANALLARIYQNDPTKSGALFYLAYVNMCNGNYGKAERKFQKLLDTDPMFAGSAEYYLAGCYLLGDEMSKSLSILNQIADRGGYYATKAKTLLYYIKHTQ